MKLKDYKKIICWIPTIIVMVTIFRLSSEVANVSDGTSGRVCSFILSIFYKGYDSLSDSVQADLIESIQFYIRKLAHFSIYAMLGICTHFGTLFYSSLKKYSRVCISLGISLLYAISDEVHQLFVEGRSGQFRDVCIDFCGSIVGTVIFILCLKLILTIKKERSKSI